MNRVQVVAGSNPATLDRQSLLKSLPHGFKSWLLSFSCYLFLLVPNCRDKTAKKLVTNKSRSAERNIIRDQAKKGEPDNEKDGKRIGGVDSRGVSIHEHRSSEQKFWSSTMGSQC